MIQWKQRLYAFLLRRILGPFLDSTSNQKLHDSIDVSLNEGRFALTDVGLNADHLNSLLASNPACDDLAIARASIDRLEINLRLQENVDDATPSTTEGATSAAATARQSGSLAWRAVRIATWQETAPAISLIAEVVVKGIVIELEPNITQRTRSQEGDSDNKEQQQRRRRRQQSAQSSGSNTHAEPPPSSSSPALPDDQPKGIISSYIDSALSSLQLTLQMEDVRFCVSSGSKNKWIEFRMSSLKYQDVKNQSTDYDEMGKQKKLQYKKTLTFSDISLVTGEVVAKSAVAAPITSASNIGPALLLPSTTTRQSTLFQASGSGQVFVRVFGSNDVASSPSSASLSQHPSDKKPANQIQQVVEVILNQRIHVSVDESSLSRIKTIVSDLTATRNINQDQNKLPPMSSNTTAALHHLQHANANANDTIGNNHNNNNNNNNSSNDDERDMQALSVIMKQYKEAYHLAENNQLRGGILVPTNAYEARDMVEDNDSGNHDDGIFDVFFDANEGSAYNYASILKESLMDASAIATDTPDDNENSQSNTLQTKIRVQLLAGSLKVNFPDERSNPSFQRPSEYLLLEFEDLQVESNIGSNSMSSQIRLSHFQVEDAQIDKTLQTNEISSVGGFHFSEGRLRIGNILRFSRAADFQDNGNNNSVISEAPCISLTVTKSKQTKHSPSHTHCGIELAPMDVTYRQRTIANLTHLVDRLKPVSNSSNDASDRSERDAVNETNNTTSLSCICDTISLKIPVAADARHVDLIDRTYESMEADVQGESCLGVLLDGLQIKYGQDRQTKINPDQYGLSCSCHHVVAFVEVLDQVTHHHHHRRRTKRRLDFFVARGRLEVNPYIPIELNVKFNCTKSQARDALPMVPSISSFKTRQADDDEDDVDRLLLSPISDMDGYSKNDFKTRSPQPQLQANVEQCTTIVIMNVPEIATELSVDEMCCICDMLASIGDTKDATKSQHNDEEESGIAITFMVDRLSLSLSGDNDYTHTVVVDRFCAHSVLNGQGLQHARVLCHDFVLYEVHAPILDRQQRYLSINGRVKNVRRRCLCGSRGRSIPIIYRSQLFTAISHESPSILIDVINNGRQGQTDRMNVHCGIYHMTHRFDVDHEWCTRLLQKLQKLSSPQADAVSEPDAKTVNDEHTTRRSLKRIFVSVVDCNFDYAAPSYCSTQSRLVVRIGDFRISGNITTPSGKLQTLSVSLGDLDMHICNHQQPYMVENSRLCRASEMINPEDSRIGFVSMSPPDTLLREMSFIHVASLDSMDAIIAIANTDDQSHPKITLSITVGLLSLHACRDSFECFSTTIGNLQAKLTALSQNELEKLMEERKDSDDTLPPTASVRKNSDFSTSSSDYAAMNRAQPAANDLLNKKNHPDFSSFLLDGYDWTTIDHNPLPDVDIPDGDDQFATWYSQPTADGGGRRQNRIPSYLLGAQKIGSSSRLNPQHFPIHPLSDPLSEGDMDAHRYAATEYSPPVKTRVLVHKLNFRLRLFDGYDWPDAISETIRSQPKKANAFVIEGELRKNAIAQQNQQASQDESTAMEESKSDKVSQLMNDLLDDGDTFIDDGDNGIHNNNAFSTFAATPLPEEKRDRIMKESEIRYFSRKTHRFFQVAANDVQVRLDAYAEKPDHRLASILELTVKDLFIMETVSSVHPIKMFGEWVNEKEHPRDSKTGALMLKMITWQPEHRITRDRDLCGDECEMSIQLLPMRCLIDQSAINFARAFFAGDESSQQDDKDPWLSELHLVPSPRFQTFRIKPWKLKVDYYPKKFNMDALRDGSIVELVNLSPIDAMVITLNEVKVQDALGFGPAFSGAVSQWIGNICSTQLHKFLTYARPFEPFTNVAGGISDLVVLPYEAYANGDSVRRAMTSGVSQLVGTVAFEALTTTSRLTKYAATQMAKVLEESNPHLASASSNPLPSRPLATPKGMSDVSSHAFESLARGLKAANYKVVVVPYRELSRNGTTGAIRSVVRGIPVLIVAPLTGATEAISYTLLGARNALRPDIRKEEEASMMGLSCDVQY
eukprot:CAMPEP_0119551746 /NCGR_PEP_ID=MMETSP1352-20130426/4920_1 /TAXON_ID=265584 /ORGANISM="Stauroneis constricta, Strain CCMP1120" /LENGTH=2017 /DNA_ID=CAMNT_0007597859 /DNA_START=85 /DNA_END=6138 /DNA_ORIENTATION=+